MHVGRVELTEPHQVTETGDGTLTLAGREAWPTTLDRNEVLARHEDVLGLRGAMTRLHLHVKDERNGYYTIVDSSSALTDYAGHSGYIDWSLSLIRHGAENSIDLESRLTGAVRQNDHDLTGERWHAPPIGHYGYYTGSTLPSAMTRTGEDGTITVYRGVPAGVSPRWGCAVEDYLRGRCRIVVGFPPREAGGRSSYSGLPVHVDPEHWEVSNGLVRVGRLFSAGSFTVSSHTGSWRPKTWQVDIGGGPIEGWESATILRNEPECCAMRLTESRSPGRVAVDLTIRRGSRIVEVYVQRGDSGTISVYLATPETLTDGTGHLVATSDDADGNKVTIGSARDFDAHADGGITKTSTTTLDCYLGVVAGGSEAVSGDDAEDLVEQYIGALPEIVAAVRR